MTSIPNTQEKLKLSSGDGDVDTRSHVKPTSILSNLAMIRVAIPRQVFGKRHDAAFSDLAENAQQKINIIDIKFL